MSRWGMAFTLAMKGAYRSSPVHAEHRGLWRDTWRDTTGSQYTLTLRKQLTAGRPLTILGEAHSRGSP